VNPAEFNFGLPAVYNLERIQAEALAKTSVSAYLRSVCDCSITAFANAVTLSGGVN
jgi:hypothetical protein